MTCDCCGRPRDISHVYPYCFNCHAKGCYIINGKHDKRCGVLDAYMEKEKD